MLGDPIARAAQFLQAEADRGFPEASHTMRFPHGAGFTGRKEVQQGDLFARAVLGRICADLARQASGSPSVAESFGRIAAAEADYLATNKLTDRAGGWSYFPGLPELPPDIDTLAAVLRLFVACAPHHLGLCEHPVALALGQRGATGLPMTWIIAPDDPPAAQEAMRRGVHMYWGQQVDLDACARLFLALSEWDHQRFAADLGQAAAALARQQSEDGGWRSSWYCGPWCVGQLCLQLLHRTNAAQETQDRALHFLMTQQRSDGGWGERENTPLETATVLHTLTLYPERPDCCRAAEQGRKILLQLQASDGSWNPSPWIRMPIGRCGGPVQRVATWHSTTITTAFCLQALVGHR